MADIFDYLYWRGDVTLDQSPFNEVDALILTRLSYVPFEKISLEKESAAMPVKYAAAFLLSKEDIEQSVIMKDDVKLLRAVLDTKRFGDLLLTHYVDRVEEENQTQFSAVTIQIGDGVSFVSYRGTDATLIGWKENFNMGFLSPVPAQVSAVKYLEDVAADQNCKLVLGGHSKGGNLAIYAAAFCNQETQNRITTIYNFDGPGFDASVLSSEKYQCISDRIASFVPQSSIVGMLLEHGEKYMVVKSTQRNVVMQHDIYSWSVEREHLLYLDQLTNDSRFIDHTLKGWIADMDTVQREKFVDALFSILAQANVLTFQEMDEKWLECTIAILSSLSDLDEETRKLLGNCLSLLAKNAKKSLGEMGVAWSAKT